MDFLLSDIHDDLASSIDGRADTKWCVEPKGKPVVWQLQLARPAALTSYAFTACPDEWTISV